MKMTHCSRHGEHKGSCPFCAAQGTEEPPPAKAHARIEARVDGTFEVWNHNGTNDVRLAICPTERIANLVLEGLSPLLVSRVEWSFEDGLTKARAALSRTRSSGEPFNGRAAALVETKLDEAELWFGCVR